MLIMIFTLHTRSHCVTYFRWAWRTPFNHRLFKPCCLIFLHFCSLQFFLFSSLACGRTPCVLYLDYFNMVETAQPAALAIIGVFLGVSTFFIALRIWARVLQYKSDGNWDRLIAWGRLIFSSFSQFWLDILAGNCNIPGVSWSRGHFLSQSC